MNTKTQVKLKTMFFTSIYHLPILSEIERFKKFTFTNISKFLNQKTSEDFYTRQ